MTDEMSTWVGMWLTLLGIAVGWVVWRLVDHFTPRVDETEAAVMPALIDLHCRIYGHAYRSHQTVWLCGVCGDRIPRDTLDQEPA
jgi:hypothetical protein